MGRQPLPAAPGLAEGSAVTARSSFRHAAAAMRIYADHPDPRVAAANYISLLVASNQPFYPIYVWWLVGDVGPALYTFLSTPFFLAVPALARRSAIAGRALLPLAGIGNTLLCAKLFGVQSAVEVFLIPCAVLAALLFRPTERMVGLPIVGLAFLSFLVLHGRYGIPVVAYGALEYEALMRLNAVSASALTVLTAIVFSNMLAKAEGSAETGGGQKSR